MTRPAIPLILALLAVPAAAQELPVLYDAPEGAVIEVRDAPRVTAATIGVVPAADGPLEVTALSDSGDWGRINVPERSGWVPLAPLSARPAPEVPLLEHGLRCFGTEPAWALTADATGVSWSRPARPPADLAEPATVTARGRARLPQASVTALPDGRDVTLVVRRAECGDGMSDNAFALSGEVLLGGETPELFTGCCSLDPVE